MSLEDKQLPSLLEGETIIVDVRVGNKTEKMILQLCEWHAVEAIKRRLVAAGKYTKKRREELVGLV